MLWLPAAGLAENLLPNGSFDTDIAGWESFLSEAWSPLDAASDPHSGSLRVTSVNPIDNGSFNGFVQCVPVTVGERYHARGTFLLPAGQEYAGMVGVSLSFQSNATCEEGWQVELPVKLVPGAWTVIDTQGIEAPQPFARVFFGFRKLGHGGLVRFHLDDARLEAKTSDGCYSDDAALCLHGGRFRVFAIWRTPAGAQRAAHAVQINGDSGYFWFLDPDNVEAVVKLVNGCGVNGHYWVFAAGLTNVRVDLTVQDTATPERRSYRNPRGTPFAPIQDTTAFTACGEGVAR